MLPKMAWLTVNRHSIQLAGMMGVTHVGLRSLNCMVHLPTLVLTYLTLDCFTSQLSRVFCCLYNPSA
jgi:hypothetical protein